MLVVVWFHGLINIIEVSLSDLDCLPLDGVLLIAREGALRDALPFCPPIFEFMLADFHVYPNKKLGTNGTDSNLAAFDSGRGFPHATAKASHDFFGSFCSVAVRASSTLFENSSSKFVL